jgi:hypothetical protein
MAEKGGIWSFTLQVDLPVHGSSSSFCDPIYEAFCTLYMPGKQDCLINVKIYVSLDAATQYAATSPATASGSITFTGFRSGKRIK